MKQALVAAVVVVVICSVQQGAAQDRPTFSGTWAYDATQSDTTTSGVRFDPRTGARAIVQSDKAPTPDLGYEFTAQQNSTGLTLVVNLFRAQSEARGVLLNGVPVDATTAAAALKYALVCRFDGSATHNGIPDARFVGGNIDATHMAEVVCTASWNHDALILVATQMVADPTAVVPPSVRRSIHLGAGGVLVVETIKVTAGVPIPSRAVYSRKPSVAHD